MKLSNKEHKDLSDLLFMGILGAFVAGVCLGKVFNFLDQRREPIESKDED